MLLAPSLAGPVTHLPDFARAPLADDIRAAQEGSADAFARLYDAEAPRVFAVCVGLTGDRRAAGDLLQDTFVRAWERLASYRGDAAFGTWLHRIAVNEFLRHERAARRRLRRVMAEGDERRDRPFGVGASDAPAAASDPTAVIDLDAAIARLPEGARRVFVLHDIAGYQHAEIATELGIAEGTSKAHLFRARRLLRGMLER